MVEDKKTVLQHVKDRLRKTGTDGVDPDHASDGAPGALNPRTGQHQSYWVLTAEDRAEGRVRPVRRTYMHVGLFAEYPTQALTEEQAERHAGTGYVLYEKYPEGQASIGRFWTQAQIDSGCGTITTMAQAIAETYAKEPAFYSHTFCVKCGDHFPVREFHWDGTSEIVGS